MLLQDTRLPVVTSTQRQGASVMQSPSDIRQTITNTIIEALQSGGLPPWKRPWANDKNAPGLHTSMSTGKPYRGINQLLLQIAAMKGGFKSKWWGTFNQIKQQNACVNKGQKGTQIVLFKKIERERTDLAGDDVKDSFFIMKTFTVFNAVQTNGLDKFRVGFGESQNDAAERYENADAVIDATGADIRYGGNEAFYNPPNDFIQLPLRSQFDSMESPYETTFHELCHWSEGRIGFDRAEAENSYAYAELVAEIGACLTMGELNLPTTTNFENHAAYLQHRIEALKADSKFIFKAAAQANKAVDHILSYSRTLELVPESAETEDLVMV